MHLQQIQRIIVQDNYTKPLNISPSYMWKKLYSWEHWQSIVDMDMLKKSMHEERINHLLSYSDLGAHNDRTDNNSLQTLKVNTAMSTH